MKLLGLLFCSFGLFAQVNVPVSLNGSGIATIPAGTFEPVFTVLPPLVMAGSQLSCSNCGGGNGTGGGGGNPWNPPASAPPPLANWTPFSASSGGATFTDVTNGVQMTASGSSGMDGLSLPAPSGPFTLTAHINALCYQQVGNGARYGIFVGDTGTKKVELQWGDLGGGQPGRFSVNYWANPSDSTASAQYTSPVFAAGFQDVWFRIQYDGTTLAFRVSPTGSDSSTWVQLATFAANSNLATPPAKLGFDSYPQSSTGYCNAVLNYWSVGQP